MGNEAFPMWNPQPKFIFGEENRKFQGACHRRTLSVGSSVSTNRNPDFDLILFLRKLNQVDKSL